MGFSSQVILGGGQFDHFKYKFINLSLFIHLYLSIHLNLSKDDKSIIFTFQSYVITPSSNARRLPQRRRSPPRRITGKTPVGVFA